MQTRYVVKKCQKHVYVICEGSLSFFLTNYLRRQEEGGLSNKVSTKSPASPNEPRNTDRKNVTDFLYLVLRLAHKVTCYFRLFSLVLVSVLRTSTNVLSKSKSKNYVTLIANLTKLFLSVYTHCRGHCYYKNTSDKLSDG